MCPWWRQSRTVPRGMPVAREIAQSFRPVSTSHRTIWTWESGRTDGWYRPAPTPPAGSTSDELLDLSKPAGRHGQDLDGDLRVASEHRNESLSVQPEHRHGILRRHGGRPGPAIQDADLTEIVPRPDPAPGSSSHRHLGRSLKKDVEVDGLRPFGHDRVSGPELQLLPLSRDHPQLPFGQAFEEGEG